ncbi:MAG: HD domain-containing protein [Thermoproteota archaeon]|nr:HD domain-containing protein [Candidatus Brockarchaeota archaeon]
MSKKEYITFIERFFGNDQRRINHSLKVLNYAMHIMDKENIRNESTRKVVIISAILHDVGIKIAEEKYNSSEGKYQEIEGPIIARAIMEENKEDPSIIDRVCYIVGHHHTMEAINGIDFQIIWEADFISNLEEGNITFKSKKDLEEAINKNLKTETSKKIVLEISSSLQKS